MGDKCPKQASAQRQCRTRFACGLFEPVPSLCRRWLGSPPQHFMGGIRHPAPKNLLDVLHLNVEFDAKCLSDQRFFLPIYREPHKKPHTVGMQGTAVGPAACSASTLASCRLFGADFPSAVGPCRVRYRLRLHRGGRRSSSQDCGRRLGSREVQDVDRHTAFLCGTGRAEQARC